MGCGKYVKLVLIQDETNEWLKKTEISYGITRRIATRMTDGRLLDEYTIPMQELPFTLIGAIERKVSPIGIFAEVSVKGVKIFSKGKMKFVILLDEESPLGYKLEVVDNLFRSRASINIVSIGLREIENIGFIVDIKGKYELLFNSINNK